MTIKHESSELATLSVTNLSVFYGEHQALKDVSITFNAGEITALIGPSGCGKTSLLSSLNRLTDLIPQCRVTGQCFLDQTDIFDRQQDVIALRRQVGMIFQKPNPFPLSIARNMDLPLLDLGIKSRKERQHLTQTALEDVGLWDQVKDRLHHSALTLSGGQQQRLCFARALALKPRVLLLDEPCSALDPISSGVIEDLILKLRSRYTLVVVTHNLAQARRIADTIACFWIGDDHVGKLVEQGSCCQIFEKSVHPVTAAYVNGHQG